MLWRKNDAVWRTILPSSIEASKSKKTAEVRFRDAFERLTLDTPEVLPKGTAVTQNNVAKEAGCDPSALRKTRFPTLISEIQHWVESHKEENQPSARQQIVKQRKRNRNARETIADLKRQRDVTVGLLADANLYIVELTEELSLATAQLKKISPPAAVISLMKRDR